MTRRQTVQMPDINEILDLGDNINSRTCQSVEPRRRESLAPADYRFGMSARSNITIEK